MCGFLLTTEEKFTHGQMRSLQRRGPDGLGFWVDSRVKMSHARLAIVGLDDRGTEPLENETHVLVFNGEIYNWQVLRYGLGLSADQAPTDAHVLLELWSREGKDCLEDLAGFWAFAVYEKASGEVVLCRDQLGIKPLYYTTEGAFKAASTIAALEHRGGLDYAALSEYVRYQFTFGDKTFFKGVKKVRPGELVVFKKGQQDALRVLTEDIWRPVHDPPATTAATRDLLSRCVVESLSSDAGFTTLCSGGLDSGLVTRIARPTHAWHCNYSDPDCNETRYAREVFPERLLVHNASEDFDLVDRIDDLVEDFDEPTVGSVIFPLDELLGRVRSRGDKVVLTGSGGDELWGGYVRHQLMAGVCLHPSYAAMFERMSAADRVHAYDACHAKGDVDAYKFYDHAGTLETFGAAFHGDSHDDPVEFDRRHFLPALLNIDDRIGGRHGLELRPSLLHQDFVRAMAPTRSDLRVELKTYGRQIADGIVPESVRTRTDKMGFTTPIGSFASRNASRARESLSASPHREKYDLSRVRWTSEPGAGKFDRKVFGLLMLDAWLRRFA